MLLQSIAPVGNSSGGHHTSGIFLLLVGLLFVIVGGLQTFNPRLLWKLNKWQYRNPEANEPSNAGYNVQRIPGGIAFIVGIAAIVAGISKIS